MHDLETFTLEKKASVIVLSAKGPTPSVSSEQFVMICGSYGSFILARRNCNYKLSGLRFHQRQMSHQDFTNRLKK